MSVVKLNLRNNFGVVGIVGEMTRQLHVYYTVLQIDKFLLFLCVFRMHFFLFIRYLCIFISQLDIAELPFHWLFGVFDVLGLRGISVFRVSHDGA